MMLNPTSYLYTRRHTPSFATSGTTTNTTIAKAAVPRSLSKRRDDTDFDDYSKNSNAVVTSDNTPRRSREFHNLSHSPPTTTTSMTTTAARPNTPTSAVQIPVKNRQEAQHARDTRRHAGSHRRQSAASQRRRHSPDSVPPSVAALLAVTSIPPPSKRGTSRQRQRMTVDSIVPRSQVSEKDLSQELSLSPLSRSPMDLLLSPPEDLLEEDGSVTSESYYTPALSVRAGSFDSLPSLGDSLGTTVVSLDSVGTPRSRKLRPPRRSLEPVSSPTGQQVEHPLWTDPDNEVSDVEFKVFDPSPTPTDPEQATVFLPLKAAFKSNLTASLRALRSAAKSLSTFTASSIPPEDLLTRSILTIDPRVPFTDEKRPPALEEEPSEAMRRYLNPTDNARLDTRPITGPTTRSYTASIQMQTYKVQRSKSVAAAASRVSKATSIPPNASKAPIPLMFPPGPRQREIRENSDFIRIAVLEHLMRKQGKFDNSQEGHARWLLPPRKSSTKPYDIGPDGVPVRWISLSGDIS